MAKISAYKVVKPGAFSHVSPQVASVRKSTYAINRLGATISSMGSVVKDLESIEAARVTNNKLAEQAERRRLQREADEAAETQAEINNLSKKGFKSNIKPTGKNKNLLKSLLPGWLNMLMPVLEFFAKLIAFPVVREMLKWWGDPANVEKVETFLHKANVIWTKLYNFGKWLINDKLIEGWGKLVGKESTLMERFEGLWDLTQGVLVLKMITDPLGMMSSIVMWIGNFCNHMGKPKPKLGDKNKSKTSKTNQRTKSKGSSKGVKGKSTFNKGKFSSTKFRAPSIQGSSNIMKKGNFWGKTWRGIKNWGKKGINQIKNKPLATTGSVLKGTAKGAANLGIGILADWGINWAADKVIFQPMQRAGDRASDRNTEKAIQEHGTEHVLKKLEADLAKEQSKTPLNKWVNMATLGYGNIFVGPNDMKVQVLQKKIDYVKNREGIVQPPTKKVVVHKKKEEKKSGFWGNLFSGWGNKKKEQKPVTKKHVVPTITKTKKPWWKFWAKGGKHKKLPEFFFGKIFKGVSKAVSGVFNGVKKAVSGVVNTVGKVVSNPIVGTALSFIPGVGPIVGAINAVNSLRQGDILGAAMGGFSALGNFASIGTTAKSIVDTPNWMLNLRMSKFGQGLASMHSGISGAISGITGAYNNFMGSKVGQLAGGVFQGLQGGGWGGALSAVGNMTGLTKPGALFGEGGFFGQGGRMSQFGGFLDKYGLSGIGNMIPGLGSFLGQIPGVSQLPGISQLFEGGFSPMAAMGGLADSMGAGGLFRSVMGMYQGSTDYATGIRSIAGELGIGAEVFGMIDKGRSLIDRSKQFALDQPELEILPLVIPVIKGEVALAPAIKQKLLIAGG
mgnify:CR=1 FL=1